MILRSLVLLVCTFCACFLLVSEFSTNGRCVKKEAKGLGESCLYFVLYSTFSYGCCYGVPTLASF